MEGYEFKKQLMVFGWVIILERTICVPIAMSEKKITIFATMRFLCTILALLVLTLSVQPVCAAVSVTDECCSAGNTCNEDGNTDEEDGCASGCNPFQVCACCAFCVVVPHELTFYALPAITFNELNWGTLPIGISDEPVSGFFQPPRVA